MIPQTTLAGEVTFDGIGLHTGCGVQLVLRPAPADTGLVFRRADLDGFPLPARVEYVAHVNYATSLMRDGVLISTVEHVLSALNGLGVDNAFVDLDNMEVPILDGSAAPFCQGVLDVGLHALDQARRVLRLRRPVSHCVGEKTLEAEPADGFSVTYTIDFAHPLIGRQTGRFTIEPEEYRRAVAPCRTFGFLRDLETLKENGLIRGGSMENAVVLSDNGVVNPEGLRFPDEFVRHKVMDLVGDIRLLGLPVLARFQAFKAGHEVHAGLARRILADPANFEVIAPVSVAVPPVPLPLPPLDQPLVV